MAAVPLGSSLPHAPRQVMAAARHVPSTSGDRADRRARGVDVPKFPRLCARFAPTGWSVLPTASRLAGFTYLAALEKIGRGRRCTRVFEALRGEPQLRSLRASRSWCSPRMRRSPTHRTLSASSTAANLA